MDRGEPAREPEGLAALEGLREWLGDGVRVREELRIRGALSGRESDTAESGLNARPP